MEQFKQKPFVFMKTSGTCMILEYFDTDTGNGYSQMYIACQILGFQSKP